MQSCTRTYEQQFLPGGKKARLTGESRYPSTVELQLRGFGKPDREHTATQEVCAETTLFFC